MATDYVVNAYDLGTNSTGAGQEGSPVTAVQITITDVDDDGLIREDGASGSGDLVNGFVIKTMKDDSELELEGPPELEVEGWYIEYELANGDQQVYFIPTDGTIPQDNVVDELDKDGDQIADVNDLDPIVPCFVSGNLIMTAKGEVPVDDLEVGDRIITRDHGIQPIRWIGKRTLPQAAMTVMRSLRPICIRRGSLGPDTPDRDLWLSPNHRLLMSGPAVRLLFETPEALVAAKFLTGWPGVSVGAPQRTTYYHLLFDQHELIISNGQWTESFHPASEGMRAFDHAQRDEVYGLFPELRLGIGTSAFSIARTALRRHEARLLAPAADG